MQKHDRSEAHTCGEKVYNELNSQFAQSGPVDPDDLIAGLLDRWHASVH